MCARVRVCVCVCLHARAHVYERKKYSYILLAQLQTQLSTEDMNTLRRVNSTLSEDCDRYIGEVSVLSQQRDELNEKVTQYEAKLQVSLQSGADLGGVKEDS